MEPEQDKIIGYVTTGNYSLALGEAYGIGAIPVAQLFDLREQAKRTRPGSSIFVKVRNRNVNVCRLARLEFLVQ